MADADWPAELPQAPRLAEYDETTPALILRTSMDAGPAKARRRLTANVRTSPFVFVMTRDQVTIFDAFFITTLLGGALSFRFKRPITGTDADYRIVDQPRYKPLAPRQGGSEIFTVSFTAELLPNTEGIESTVPADPGEFLMLLAGASPTMAQDGDSLDAASEDEAAWPIWRDVLIPSGSPPANDDLMMMMWEWAGFSAEDDSGDADRDPEGRLLQLSDVDASAPNHDGSGGGGGGVAAA